MAELRVSREAEAKLDAIWMHIARESGSIETATRVVESITDRFWLLARSPFIGRRRDDLRPGLRGFPVNNYVIIYRVEHEVVLLILHVMHGSRDIPASFLV